jgi:hypothetical protein
MKLQRKNTNKMEKKERERHETNTEEIKKGNGTERINREEREAEQEGQRRRKEISRGKDRVKRISI